MVDGTMVVCGIMVVWGTTVVCGTTVVWGTTVVSGILVVVSGFFVVVSVLVVVSVFSVVVSVLVVVVSGFFVVVSVLVVVVSGFLVVVSVLEVVVSRFVVVALCSVVVSLMLPAVSVLLVPSVEVVGAVVVSVEGRRGEMRSVVVEGVVVSSSTLFREQPINVTLISASDRASNKMPILCLFIIYHTFKILALIKRRLLRPCLTCLNSLRYHCARRRSVLFEQLLGGERRACRNGKK